MQVQPVGEPRSQGQNNCTFGKKTFVAAQSSHGCVIVIGKEVVHWTLSFATVQSGSRHSYEAWKRVTLARSLVMGDYAWQTLVTVRTGVPIRSGKGDSSRARWRCQSYRI